METVPERRAATGRRSEDRTVQALWGVLHDLGHEITTLAYLVESELKDVAGVELIGEQVSRLRTLVSHALAAETHEEIVPLRPLLAQLVKLADRVSEPSVVLADGAAAAVRVDGTVLWRILANVLGNAVRAAGPDGHVHVELTANSPVTVSITDDGPGFGRIPPGTASLGLVTVAHLAEASGAQALVGPGEPEGTCVRIVFPSHLSEGEHE
ncbi:HAMP domain-containing sensor histidine kinase [Amycolatopsis sp. NPDC005232]|uniref:sensor histidine kinase n=1 Tax=Amycolatopsis sp. NPDC005232 TaxID=3157027 RepID=UPI0033B67A70